ncbi:MAG: dihydroorotase [Gammaproteobacteria bacterium]|nr:dihydroorotase [Gammaproteobacteria bacterium]
MSRVLIQNGRVIDPKNGLDKNADVYIADGKIAAIGEAPVGFSADEVIDASGQIVSPGFVDLSVALREPGFEYKATIESETRAAVQAGVTTLCCPPDTRPVIDTPSVVESIQQRNEQAGYARVVMIGALTSGMEGKQLSEIAALKAVGCVGVGNGVHAIKNALVMRRAMEYASSHDMTVFIHPMDPWLAADGFAHEGAVATRLGLNGIPEIAETIAVSRDLALAELTGARVHFCRLSTAAAVRILSRAGFDGLPVSGDVAAHQLHLVDVDMSSFDSNYHVIPPLRSQRDKEGLRAGLIDNVLSGICSDHQPHDVDAKVGPLKDTAPGISGLASLLPLTLKLVEETSLSLSDALGFITYKPAKVLGLNVGAIAVGDSADVCVFDPEACWILNEDTMISRGKNSPYMNRELVGKVSHTLYEGRIVYRS